MIRRRPDREEAVSAMPGEPSDERPVAGVSEGSPDAQGSGVHEALRWALEACADPARASADWLASDIDGSRASAEALFTDAGVSLIALRQAKSAYKTMRLVGETSADRRLGARLYAAAIAAGLVWHGRRISRQSDGALERAFRGLLDDSEISPGLRTLAGQALCVLKKDRR